MNSYERVINRIHGKKVDRIPNLNIIMQFAALYIGVPYNDYVHDYRLLVEGNLRCAEDFGIDAVSCISDPAREAGGFGANVAYGRDDVPHLLGSFIDDDYEKLQDLQIRSAAEVPRMLDRIKAVELYKKQVKGEKAIIGWVEGPFAEAADLRGVGDALMDLMIQPDHVKALMEVTLAQGILFAKEQIEAGADIIGVGDAAASLAGPALYDELILPYEIRLLEAIKQMGGYTKLHICGNIQPYLPSLPVEHCDIIDLDWMVSLQDAIRLHGTKTSFCGNLDPVAVILRCDPQTLKNHMCDCLSTANSTYMFAGGCEIPKFTPHENMRAMAEVLKE